MHRSTRVVLAAALLLAALPASAAPRTARKPPVSRTPAPGPAWLRALGASLPEAGLEAGLDACGPRLNDCSEAGVRAARAAIRRARSAVRGTSPDAALLRSRLARESFAWNELDFRVRRPGAVLPLEGLLDALTVQAVPFPTRLEWLGSRLGQLPRRLALALESHGKYSPEMVRYGILDAATTLRALERIRRYADTLEIPPEVQAGIRNGCEQSRGMVERYSDFLEHDLLPGASEDARPEPSLYRRVLAEGYGYPENPATLEAQLSRAVASARRETDSLAACLDRSLGAAALVEILKGSHPGAAEVLPAVTAVFRGAEEGARSRWPGLPAAPLEVAPMDFGGRVQGQVSSYARPRPLRAAFEEPLFGVALVDPAWPSDVQETFLKQLSFYFDSVLAARHDVPGETMLGRVHAAGPGERTWAAGPHTFQAWGVFAQQLASRSGAFVSVESRLFEAWTRLTALARAQQDLRLGQRITDTETAVSEMGKATGIDPSVCRGYLKEILENPGRQAAVGLRALAYRDAFDALRARGASETEALSKLAGTALYLPTDQARLLGLVP
ncbi:MAG: DUF885 family protein [Candidatus Eisenbacteria bacterium]|nr:DUF885 family protein [Candidatus Eisenbacteria bacterium]